MNDNIAQIRFFNRFYATQIGMLKQHYLNSNYSMTEVRLMYEISQNEKVTAQALSDVLSLDKGYISRILKLLEKDGMIVKNRSLEDARVYYIQLTKKAMDLLAILHNKVGNEIESTIKDLTDDEQKLLISSMDTIKKLLSYKYRNKSIVDDVTYRQGFRSGDLGYIIHLHGLLYEKESGFSDEFEKYVIKTFYDYTQHSFPENDRIYLADYNKEIVGSIAVIEHNNEESQLRWFLIDPRFRGTGVGKKLLNDALDYCKERRYKTVYLTTSDIQKRAIEMYKKVGFVLAKSSKVNQWGKIFNEEQYELKF